METMTTSIILPFLVFFPFIRGDFHCEPDADWEGNGL